MQANTGSAARSKGPPKTIHKIIRRRMNTEFITPASFGHVSPTQSTDLCAFSNERNDQHA